MTSAELSDALNLHAVKDHNWHIQACCALTGEGYLSLSCYTCANCSDLTFLSLLSVGCLLEWTGWRSRSKGE
jgi:hypothetical protein